MLHRNTLYVSLGTLLLATLLALPARAEPPEAPPARQRTAAASSPWPIVLEAVLESRWVGRQHVVFILPPDYDGSAATYPALVAFAGKGESVRGNRAGAWGWVEKYGLLPAMASLHRGVIDPALLPGAASEPWRRAYDEALVAAPYQGLVVICPFPTTRRADRAGYERFILEELIPYSLRHLRLRADPASWGVDGISLGGALSLSLGFGHAERFGAIGAQQAAVGSGAALLTRLDQAPGALAGRRINLITSDHDPFRGDIEAFSAALRRRDIPHRLLRVPGRHDKVFAKGFGALELLLFHDRALRGLAGPLPE